MDDLANIIKKFPDIAENSTFVIVPGPSDPGSAATLPRPPVCM